VVKISASGPLIYSTDNPITKLNRHADYDYGLFG